MKKILCATDGTDHSIHAIELAASLASKFGASLTICAVNVLRGGIRGPIIYDWEDDEVKKIIDDAIAHAKKTGTSRVEEITLSGRDASAVIVQYAEANGYDHIVVGTGDKKGISRLVLGSVAAGVSASAHCSVTIAR